MILRKWTDDDTRWLKANFARLDVQKISYQLGVPLEEIQKRVKALKLVVVEPAAARKAPTSLKEAKKELSAARREYEKAMDAFHKRRFDEAARRFEDVVRSTRTKRSSATGRRCISPPAGTARRHAPPSRVTPRTSTTPPSSRRTAGTSRRRSHLVKQTAGKRDGDGRLHISPPAASRFGRRRPGDHEPEEGDRGATRTGSRRVSKRTSWPVRSHRLREPSSREARDGHRRRRPRRGAGVRMKSALPKVLHAAAGRPLIDRAVARGASRVGGGRRLARRRRGRTREPSSPHVGRVAPRGRPAGAAARDGRRGPRRRPISATRRASSFCRGTSRSSSRPASRLLGALDARRDSAGVAS